MPTDTLAAAKQAVLTAYRGMWLDFQDAGRTADWEASVLGDHAIGDAEVVLRHGLYVASQKGQILKGKPLLHPQVTEFTENSATIADCVDDSHFGPHAKSGKQAKEAEAGGRHKATALLVRREGSWYVSSYLLDEVGTC
ncbi:hypothetical protein [Spongiactinospora sp. 9N601]|uniref:hypothetical protein n=1 Tax=Spongiactinospora sp. 9N601 TaxID=3375149 RepID=UPI003796EF75